MTEHELDTLLRDYGGAVRSVCRAILPGHPQDAEEAEADTFLDRGMSTAKENCRTLLYCREISVRTILVRLSIHRPSLLI